MSSSDGFCSTLSFTPGELGQVYTGPTGPANATNIATSSIATPLPTPTQIPPSPVKSSHGPASSGTPAASASRPPASPARSNSASSVVTTQSSNQQGVVNNPTPTLGSVPSVTAANSAQPSALPLTTPPQTPLPTPSQGGAGTTVSVLGKRDARTTSESEKEESKGPETTGQQPKKRRIAPTLISASTDMPSSTDGNAGAST
jgi:chromatin assembly factor 1 subunit B